MRAMLGECLDDAAIMRHAPSVFVPLKHPDRSSEYRHIPTSEVLNRLRDNGFMPVAASQSGEPGSIRSLFARHMLRFRQADNLDVRKGDVIPELVLLNAHDGSGSYELAAGLFRIICLNGLIAGCGELFRIKVRHTGDDQMVERVLAASQKVIESTPALIDRVTTLQTKELDPARQLKFAQNVLKLSPTRMTVEPSDLLSPRREEDMPTDAWTVMNVVQENVIRGGVTAIDRRGSTRRTSSISDVERSLQINRAVWDLAEAA
jgi:hypothetical protein